MENNQTNSPIAFQHKRQRKDSKDYAIKLFKALYLKPISRRMAATKIGFPDQTFMVTQFVYDWIKQGSAQVVGVVKCERSGQFVEAVTTNPNFFKSIKNNQLKMF
jgi:hypothetical protein